MMSFKKVNKAKEASPPAEKFLTELEFQAEKRDLRGRLSALENYARQLHEKLKAHGIHIEPLE